MPKGNRYDAEHLRNISAYQRQIDEIFKRAAEEVARIAESSGAEHDPDKPFSFDDYPSVRKRVDKMTADLSSRVERTIVNGIKAQWELSNRKNDDLVETVTGLSADEFPDTLKRRYFGTNESARKAFLDRKEKGLSLSDRVWKQSERFRKDMELGIDVSLGEGMSADELGRQLRGYLNHPETLFRRVRDERGNLVLSRNARLFHPGQGVYRSSYMNARRLAATETNMAYRSADYERWKNLDFVVGIEIGTSNNHTTKTSTGKTVELRDICDELAGRYPKDFKFVGWHPHCRCIATTILKTEEEMAKDTERILNGEEPLSAKDSENYIGNTPDNFNDWAVHNLKRIETARQNGTLPYFLKDNQKYITVQRLGKALLDTAKGFAGVDWSELEKAINKGDVAEIRRQIDAVSLKVDEARNNTPKTLQHLDEVIAKYQYTDPQLAARAAEIKAKMLEIFENNDFGMDVHSWDFEDIVNDNEFKNQFQVGHSGGKLASQKTTGEIEQDNCRLVASHRMFSTTDDSLFDLKNSTYEDSKYLGPQFARAEYEKYGHLLDRNKTAGFLKQPKTAYRDDFGVQVRFKRDSVRDRCTWTLTDSLMASEKSRYMQPTLVSNPGVESFNKLFNTYLGRAYGKSSNTIDNFLNSNDSVSTMLRKMSNGYIELQYHGKLTMDDVQSLVFSRHPNADFPHLVQKLIDKGIEIWYYDDSVKKVVKYKP